jgi:antirestriction protein ArdC
MSTRTPVQTTQERVQELHEQLQRGVEALVNASDWQNYLRLMATAYRYSPQNALLLYLQKPDASLVHGYRAWQRLGRQVRKGERALHVLAPVTYKVEMDDGDTEHHLRGFKIASVFDLSQTEGPELPNMMPGIVEGKAPAVMKAAMERRLAERGYTVTYQRMDTGPEGWTRPVTREVAISTSYPAAHQLAVLAHELAHVEFDHVSDIESYRRHRGLMEVKAESTAWLLCQFAGIDASPTNFKYLASWSGSRPELLLQVAAKVQRVTQSILETVPEFSRGFSAVVELEGRGIERGIA